MWNNGHNLEYPDYLKCPTDITQPFNFLNGLIYRYHFISDMPKLCALDLLR
jgi:hypothetical protein